jgi:hypothetical protein
MMYVHPVLSSCAGLTTACQTVLERLRRLGGSLVITECKCHFFSLLLYVSIILSFLLSLETGETTARILSTIQNPTDISAITGGDQCLQSSGNEAITQNCGPGITQQAWTPTFLFDENTASSTSGSATSSASGTIAGVIGGAAGSATSTCHLLSPQFTFPLPFTQIVLRGLVFRRRTGLITRWSCCSHFCCRLRRFKRRVRC